MDDQNRNLLLATVLSFAVIFVWYVGGAYFFPDLFPAAEEQLTAVPADVGGDGTATTPTADPAADAAANGAAPAAAVANTPRLPIETARLTGSLSLTGARIDDLLLNDYRLSTDPQSDNVRLLSPVGKDQPYYALFGWAATDGIDAADLPGAETLWSAPAGAKLTVETPVTLTWTSPAGLTFERQIAVDEDFLFTVTDKVTNTGTGAASIYPWGVVARHGEPPSYNVAPVHQGAIRRTDGVIEETTYSNVTDLTKVEGTDIHREQVDAAEDGWIGFTDHYWMAVMIPEQGRAFTAVTEYLEASTVYQTKFASTSQVVEPGASVTVTSRLFAGAKEWEVIRGYQNEAGVAGFIDSIDWGWFFFLTKPFFWVLHYLHGLIGNMGLAIIALTFIVKAVILPIAGKSYVSMARMKELQPELEAIKERAGDDKQKLQKETMELYRTRKVNPAAGCLPALIQIPIFFSLYKILSVTIELRQAPFFGWIKDLSIADTSSIMNLFGLLPWAGPEVGSISHVIFLGILPILLGVTMWFQQKLNPMPTDPVQQTIFAWMPWVFMFMMSTFASGLIVYYITNNTLSVLQQYVILTRHGHRPDLFGNIKSGFTRKPAETAKPLATKSVTLSPAAGKTVEPKPVAKKPANSAKPPTGKAAPRKK